MKSLRLWLMLLLALLLPVRGALAVAMQCSGHGAAVPLQVQAQLPASHADHLMHQMHDMGADHAHHHAAMDHASGHEPSSHADHAQAGAVDKCSVCAASCSATAPVSASATVAEPQPVAPVFPRLHAPPPSFVSEGPERPPRST